METRAPPRLDADRAPPRLAPASYASSAIGELANDMVHEHGGWQLAGARPEHPPGRMGRTTHAAPPSLRSARSVGL
jgi:hypothetical protein